MRQFLVLILGLTLLGCGKKQPLYKGQPASYWRQLLRGPDVQGRREAVIAMGALNVKEALPELIALLNDKDKEIRSLGAQAIWSIGDGAASAAVPALISLLNEEDAGVRLNVVGALGQIAAEPGKTIPALKNALGDTDIYVRARQPKGWDGSAQAATVVPILAAALQDEQKNVRVAVAYALAEMGPAAQSADHALKEAAKERDGDVKTAVASALKAIQEHK